MGNYTDKEIRTLFSYYFRHQGQPFKAYDYQIPIARSIINRESRRLIITATTRAGKSMILALTALTFGLEYPGTRIRLIGPMDKQAQILMGYIIEHVADNPLLIQQLSLRGTATRLRLQQELKKSHIRWNNGTDFMVFSAHGDAERLQGFGGDLIIIDESPNIDDETYRKYIVRMAENENSIIVQIGNPTKLNHFFTDWNAPAYVKLKIGWKDCLRDGRFTQAFIEEKARECGGWDSPIFRAMYCADFVEDATNNLIKFADVDAAVDRELKLADDAWYEMGVDVARFGTDFTVLTSIKRDMENVKVMEVDVIAQKDNTEVARRIINKHNQVKFEAIKIDDLGVGGGVVDICSNAGLPIRPFIASEASRAKMFKNRKAQAGWMLREYFADGTISIPNDARLIAELKKETYEYTPDSKIRLMDPEDKSPDFFDSLLIAVQGVPMRMASAAAITY
jgi:hypothetical protein